MKQDILQLSSISRQTHRRIFAFFYPALLYQHLWTEHQSLIFFMLTRPWYLNKIPTQNAILHVKINISTVFTERKDCCDAEREVPKWQKDRMQYNDIHTALDLQMLAHHKERV